jgi:hypothetical protein
LAAKRFYIKFFCHGPVLSCAVACPEHLADNLSAISESGRYAIYRQLNRPLYRIRSITGTIPTQQLYLQMVKRIDVRRTVTNAPRQRRIVL